MIISIDQGTTSCRSILFDKAAEIIETTQKEFKQFFPKSGWVEHDAKEILECQTEVLHELLTKNGNGYLQEIKAIGITNQRETIVAWNKKTGVPLYNAIVWQDTRTTNYCQDLKDKGFEKLIKEKTGLLLDSYFSASKMNWILENIPEAKQLAAKNNLLFGTIDTWLIWNLTDEKNHFTDPSNASRTLLFNINTLEWDAELLDIFGIPRNTLPTVKQSSDNFGTYTYNGHSFPINGVAGDQQSALFGQCCFEKGDAKNTYGTGCFMLMNTGNSKIASNNGLISTIAWQIDGKTSYALEGSVFVAGSGVQWLRDGIQIINNATETEDIIKDANPTSSLYFVPAFAGLGAPHWNMNARGMLIGLTRDTNRADVTKATLDAMAYQTKDVLTAMEKDAKTQLNTLNVDGGACNNNYLMQFQSDLLNIPVDRPICKESTALGVAFLAGIQCGLWKFEELSKIRTNEKLFLPTKNQNEIKSKYNKWNDAVERCKDWEVNV